MNIHPLVVKFIADQLVEIAKKKKEGKRDYGYVDDRAYCSLAELKDLLEAGATVIRLNYQEKDSIFIHEVKYQDHVFLTATTFYDKELRKYIARLN